MAEVHQKQMEALLSAHNQQFASVLSVLGKPWSCGGATGATPSTTTTFFPPLARPATIFPVSYFEPCFFLVVTYNDFIQMLKTLYIHFCQFDHVSYDTTWHVSGHRAMRRYFFVWPDLRVVAFLVGSENLTMQGRCCRNF
jgi:hypothetical protein